MVKFWPRIRFYKNIVFNSTRGNIFFFTKCDESKASVVITRAKKNIFIEQINRKSFQSSLVFLESFLSNNSISVSNFSLLSQQNVGDFIKDFIKNFRKFHPWNVTTSEKVNNKLIFKQAVSSDLHHYTLLFNVISLQAKIQKVILLIQLILKVFCLYETICTWSISYFQVQYLYYINATKVIQRVFSFVNISSKSKLNKLHRDAMQRIQCIASIHHNLLFSRFI